MGTTTGPTVAEAATELLAAKWALLRGPSRTGLVDGLAHVIAATHGSSVDRHTSYTAAYRSLSRAELSPAQLDVWRKMTQTSARVTALDKQTVTDLVAVLASNLTEHPHQGPAFTTAVRYHPGTRLWLRQSWDGAAAAAEEATRHAASETGTGVAVPYRHSHGSRNRHRRCSR